jgi:hypothetical protein
VEEPKDDKSAVLEDFLAVKRHGNSVVG